MFSRQAFSRQFKGKGHFPSPRSEMSFASLRGISGGLRKYRGRKENNSVSQKCGSLQEDSLTSFLSGKAKTWSKGTVILSCAVAGLEGGLWDDELRELSPCCLLPQLRRRHPAGKVPAINTNLVKYRENLKVWGSGRLPADVWVRR